jgi:hypothetical protein
MTICGKRRQATQKAWREDANSVEMTVLCSAWLEGIFFSMINKRFILNVIDIWSNLFILTNM